MPAMTSTRAWLATRSHSSAASLSLWSPGTRRQPTWFLRHVPSVDSQPAEALRPRKPPGRALYGPAPCLHDTFQWSSPLGMPACPDILVLRFSATISSGGCWTERVTAPTRARRFLGGRMQCIHMPPRTTLARKKPVGLIGLSVHSSVRSFTVIHHARFQADFSRATYVHCAFIRAWFTE